MSSYNCCQKGSKNNKELDQLIPLLKIVGEESRLKILCILRQGQHCVCELQEHLFVSQSLLSHHLKDLKDSEIVTDKKEGLKVYYSLTTKGKKVTAALFNLVDL
ncbi:metalloregulator ArsR/SmtB family transcription factor [Patescibacteria group bacterium]|nr:metalloregulator ArsR/SmtB family transcription factor [Patescibacteria group bacterium]